MKKTTKAFIIFSLLVLPLFLTSCNELSEEEAITITQEFVNSKIKFYVNEDESAPVVNQADISVTNTEKKDKYWYIYLNIRSEQTGELKQSNIVVIVDAKEGKVVDFKSLSNA